MGTDTGQIIQIGCNGLIFKDNKLLLGKRKNHYGEGTWGLPGGHLEYGESLEEAIKRELKEEVGILAKNLIFVSITEGEKIDSHYLQANFEVIEFEGEITLGEPEYCEALEFFSLNNLPEIFPPHKNIIEAYLKKVVYLR